MLLANTLKKRILLTILVDKFLLLLYCSMQEKVELQLI